MTEPKDFTAFYTATEEAARELKRLLEAGALEGVVKALRRVGARLELEVYCPPMKHKEYLGEVEVGEGEGEESYEYDLFLASRVEQWVTFRDGRRRRIVMPDHICPECGHAESNYIVTTQKTCGACQFQW